jgi:pimeloyl-ACP methyl ester carboxylesterase
MFRTIRGEQVHTLELGGGPTTIVGLTGVFGTTEIWQQPFELLHHRFRTITYDHFGTGLTHVPPERVTFEAQLGLLGDVLDAFEVERCVLAGDSSLSTVAARYAHDHPDRVDALVLMAGGFDYTPTERTTRFVAGLRHHFEPTLHGFVDLCLPEDDTGHLRRWLRAVIARTGSERCAALVESFYNVEVAALLPAIEVPTLIIHGADDVIHPVDDAHQLAALLPNVELLVLEDTGHVPTFSRPREVSNTIAALADRIT